MANRIGAKADFEDSSEGEKEAQEFELTEWLIAVGAKVKKGEAIAMIETAKATVEIYSPASGEVVEIMLKAGDKANYGAVLCIIETI